jgi:hypothetical protein
MLLLREVSGGLSRGRGGVPRVPIWKGPRTAHVWEKVREGVDIGYCKRGFMRLAAARGAWNRSFMLTSILKRHLYTRREIRNRSLYGQMIIRGVTSLRAND